MEALSVAIVGYGLAGRRFHAPLIDTTPGLALTHVVTTSPERVAAAAADHPHLSVVGTVDALWEVIDLLVVAAPNDAHVALAEAAIDHGVAVVVDKPLALDARSAARLVARAAGAAVPLSVFHNRRWDSDLLTLRTVLAQGRLGAVRRFESRFERWRPDAPAEVWRAGDPTDGGGLLLDLGTHLVDQARWLFGPVSSVYAESAVRRDGHAGEDDAFLALRHVDGVISHLWVSAVAAAAGPRLRVQGSAAGIVFEGLDGQEAVLRAGGRPGPDWGVEPPAAAGRLIQGDRVEAVPRLPGDWPTFYRGLEAALRGGGPLPVDPNDAVAVLRVLEAARASAADGSVVTLPPGEG